MLIVGFPAGPWATNCFVVAPGPNSECIIIDPGKDVVPGIDDILREHNLEPAAVVLSHGHLDHMWSVLPVCGSHHIPAYIHPDDRKLLADPMLGISGETKAAFESMTGGRLQFSEPDDVQELVDGSKLDLAGVQFTVDHAPGHTPGSTAFRLDANAADPPVMFSGDLLFEGSIGRTDLPGGSLSQMRESLKRVVIPLDDETVVLPGHGGATTIGKERLTNPYLAEFNSPAAPTKGL